jgi:hypothetical protein
LSKFQNFRNFTKSTKELTGNGERMTKKFNFVKIPENFQKT